MNFFIQIFFLTFKMLLMAARVCGSVFKIKFRCLIIKFESVETSPGFAWLLGENWR